MRKRIKPFVIISSACMATLAAPAFAQNIPALASGNWENPSIWVGGVVPNSTNNVYIGATDPAGAVTTAAVTLTANESINSVFVGYGTPTNGTLNLNGHALTIGGTLTINDFSGTGHLVEGGGSFTAATLAIFDGNSSLTMGTGDVVGNIDIESGATLTTAATGNLTSGGAVANGGALNLGANMSLSGALNIEGTGATLNLAGNNLSAGTLEIGSFLTSAVNFSRGSGTPGTLTVNHLFIGNGQNLTLIAGDTVSGAGGGAVIFTGATLTTTTATNITTNATADAGTLTLGANLNATTSTVNVEGANAMLNLNGNNLSAGTLEIGSFLTSAVNFSRGSGTPGTLTVNHLFIGNGQNLTLIAGDSVSGAGGGAVIFTGATLTTTTATNITTNATADAGTLTLGANLNVGTAAINVEGVNAALNLAGNNLSAGTLDLGSFLTSSVTLNRGGGTPGTLSLNSLNLANGQNVTLVAGDTITGGGINGVGGTGAVSLFGGATLSTVSNTNVTCTVNVVASTLNLGADMFIGNQTVNTETGGTVNLNGHNLAASYLLLGYDGTSTVTLNRGSATPGTLTLGNLFLGNGQNLTLLTGDTIISGDNGVNVTDGATLTTAATSNISNNLVNVLTGGALKLGASLSTTGTLNVQDTGSNFNAQGNAVTAGDLLFGSNGTAPVAVSNLGTVSASELHVANGTSLTLHGGDTISGVIDVENTSAVSLAASAGNQILRAGSLTIGSSAKVDLADNDMIIDYTGASPLTAIRSLIITGRNGGAWTGDGLTSSAAATVAATPSNTHKTALGYGEASTLGVTSFAGQTVDSTSVLVRYTLAGDANLDGKVNAQDFDLLARDYGDTSGNALWTEGDFNDDGIVNGQDFNALAANFNAASVSTPALGSLVPEPTAIAMLGLLAARVRRRRIGVGSIPA